MTMSDVQTRASWNLGDPTGGIKSAGEDDEATVSRILWGLATNSKYEIFTNQIVAGAAEKYTNNYEAVYQFLVDGQPLLFPKAAPLGPITTLNQLWTALACNTANSTPAGLAIQTFGALFQTNNVTPVASPVTFPNANAGGQFIFNVPLLCNKPNTFTPDPGYGTPAFNDKIRAFDRVVLTFYSIAAGAVKNTYSETLLLIPGTTLGGTPGLTEKQGNPGDPSQQWTYNMPQNTWNAILKALRPLNGAKIWVSVGGVVSALAASYTPYYGILTFVPTGGVQGASFNAKAGNDLVLAYDIVPPASGWPADDGQVSIPSFDVDLYAVSDGDFDDATTDGVLVASYPVTDPAYLRGTASNYQFTLDLPASSICGACWPAARTS